MATLDGYDATDNVAQSSGLNGASGRFVTYDAYLAFLGEPPFRYYLAMYDNTGTRHYWTDSLPQTTNAPAGPTYVTSTLTVLFRQVGF